jgi:nitroreductase
MDFVQLAKSRYSSRKYKQLSVEDDKLNFVLEAGRVAPSAANYQPWFFVVVRGENIENIRNCYQREWFKTAPMCIIICSDHSKSWKRSDGKDHGDIDAAIAADHMTLAATSIGLATCWVCNFNRPKLADVLNLPDYIEPVIILPLGYPGDTADIERHASKRKVLDEIVIFEKFSK